MEAMKEKSRGEETCLEDAGHYKEKLPLSAVKRKLEQPGLGDEFHRVASSVAKTPCDRDGLGLSSPHSFLGGGIKFDTSFAFREAFTTPNFGSLTGNSKPGSVMRFSSMFTRHLTPMSLKPLPVDFSKETPKSHVETSELPGFDDLLLDGSIAPSNLSAEASAKKKQSCFDHDSVSKSEKRKREKYTDGKKRSKKRKSKTREKRGYSAPSFLRGIPNLLPRFLSQRETGSPLVSEAGFSIEGKVKVSCTGQWTAREEAILLHLTIGMINCDLKTIAAAARECGVDRGIRAVDKKLKRMLAYGTWKVKDAEEISRKAKTLLEHRAKYELSQEQQAQINQLIEKSLSPNPA